MWILIDEIIAPFNSSQIIEYERFVLLIKQNFTNKNHHFMPKNAFEKF